MKSIKSLSLWLGLGVSAVLQIGCLTPDDGGAAAVSAKEFPQLHYVYTDGWVKATEPVTLGRAWQASLAVMRNLEYNVIEQGKDNIQARVIAVSPGDTKIQVRLSMVKENQTEIRIRAGAFGDELTSLRILDRIQKQCGAAPR